jgi:hypothetical protein
MGTLGAEHGSTGTRWRSGSWPGGRTYELVDNGFRRVADPAALDAVTGSLGSDQIRAFVARWVALLRSRSPSRTAAGYGYGYASSTLQVEVPDMRVFDGPVRGPRVARGDRPRAASLGMVRTNSCK